MLSTLAAHADDKLTGTLIGTNPAKAFDGSLDTYMLTNQGSNAWAGLDLGTPHVITRINWAPRQDGNGAQSCLLGVFEGSNDPSFVNAVPIYLIDNGGQAGQFNSTDIHVTRGFRYVRYVGPHNSRCQMAELEFYGHEGEGDDSHFYQVTNLPTLSYHTTNGQDPQSKTTELEAEMVIVYDDGTRIQEYPITARCRGNASYGFDKKPYRIKFNDGKSHHLLRGSELESPAKAKKWTLINNYGDKTLMRNIVAFEVSRRMQMPYTPWCQPVDVIVNGEYKGCYQLCDQITVNDDRVAVTEMSPTDNEGEELTGGYLIEVDNNAGSEPSRFYSKRGTPVTIKSPQSEDITNEQHKYIENWFNQMEASVWSSTLSEQPSEYCRFLDVEAYLRNLITGEFCGNTDTFHSTYMSKERGSDLLVAGPIWDHDLSFDNDNRTYPINNHRDWIYRTGGTNAGDMRSFTDHILSDPYAAALFRSIWADARDCQRMEVNSLVHFVDSMEQVLMASQRLNFLRWPILGQYVHMNAFAYPTYAQEVNMVRRCVTQRVGWMDHMLDYGEDGGDDPDIPIDGNYVIASAADLVNFAQTVNRGAMQAKGTLTADIDMRGHENDFEPIGSTWSPYAGHFDGQGHTISHLVIERGEQYVGLFGAVTGGADIRGIILDSSCRLGGGAYVGLIGGSNGSGTVRLSALGNEGTVTAQNQNAGGIIGVNMGSSASWIISDCYVTGTVQGGLESAALSGWVGSNAQVSNCYSLATVTGTESSKYFYRGEGSFTNCFDIYGSQGLIPLREAVARSGELCMELNGGHADGIWHQTLATDPFPTPADNSLMVFASGGKYSNGLVITQTDADSPWAHANIGAHAVTLPDDIYACYTLPQSASGNTSWGANTLKYHRTFTNDDWQCWYVPFDYTVTSSTYKKFSIACFEGIEADADGTPVVTFSLLSGRETLKANTPYLIRSLCPNAEGEEVFTSAIRLLQESCTPDFRVVLDTLSYALRGAYAPVESNDAEACYALRDGEFQLLNDDEMGRPLRFQLFVSTVHGSRPAGNSLASAIALRIVGDDDGIDAPIADDTTPYPMNVFDLLGRKVATLDNEADVNALQPGIYLIGGKKVLIER